MKNADRGKSSRRGRTLLGVAGLASVIGTSAFLASGRTNSEHGPENAAPAAQMAVQQAMSEAETPPGPTAQTGPMGPAVPGTAAPGQPKTTAERLNDARSANKRMGTEVRQPRVRTVADVDSSKVRRVERGTLKEDRRMMRIVSSRQDLTDYAELGWIGDEGVPHGPARCSRTIQMSDKPAAEKPTLMICWRTTPEKSVYTITVDLKKSPTAREGVAALEKEWRRMS
jgi:hypothetical protein